MSDLEIMANPSADRPRDGQVRLRSSIKIEPLIDRWYAWPHLLAPAQQAMNLAFRYLPVARSFIAAPTVHTATAADPAMFGGPFVDLPISAVESVKRYVAETEIRRADALAFARSFREFDTALQVFNGYSLNDAREQAPAALRGRCELVYDLNNHPKIRLLEEMFLDDDLGHRQAQALYLSPKADVERPFFLSTPRLDVGDGLMIEAAFNSDAADLLTHARRKPVDLMEAASVLRCDVEALAPFFTNEPDPRGSRAAFEGSGVRLSYFGHACLLIETQDVTILTDPVVTHDRMERVRHLAFDDLPDRIDVMFISHGHQDHFSPEMLIQLRDRVGVVLIPPNNAGELSDPSLRRLLLSLGYKSIVTLEPLEPYRLSGGNITALPFSGEHCDLDVHSKQCAMIELRGRRICLLVDSDAIDIDVYRRMASRLERPDVIFIGMECFGAPLSWLYGPLISTSLSKRYDGSRRLSGADCQRAWRLIEMLRPRQVFIYAMGQEPWMRHLMGLKYHEDSIQIRESSAFVKKCKDNNIPAERLHEMREIEI